MRATRAGDRDVCLTGHLTSTEVAASARLTGIATPDKLPGPARDCGNGLAVTKRASGEGVVKRRP